MAPRINRGVSFFGLVGATMAALKLKEHFNGFSTEEEGRVALHSPSADYTDREAGLQTLEEEEGLLNTDIQKPIRKHHNPRCVCCGLNCGLFWKAVGIVAAFFVIISVGKFIWWALTPSPTGLEGMPIFSESLGCLDASFLYNGGETTITIPVGDRHDHAVDVHGDGVGTFTVTEAPADMTEIQYKLTIQTNDQSLLDQVTLQYPAARPDGSSDGISRLLIGTPRLNRDSSSCIRYDVTMYIPKTLKKLHILPHAVAHVRFDPQAHIDLEDTFVTLYDMDKRNLIEPSENLRSTSLSLEVYRGWIVGHAAIVNETTITTQRGDGVANVNVHPTPPANPTNPEPVSLRTTTGAGRTDLYFENDKAYPHRPIKSIHSSSRNADVYLTYKNAEFDGNVKLDSSSFTATGAKSYSLGGQGKGQWTHWVGDMDGKDEIFIKSRGWTGLYF
ncbi:hypothetical protein J3R30DRAFT_1682837 [Lentinula aciculospora]|uniref:Uncharacterized protein n=1 Tax=Lentinula aciculospora TaxID=153920 RepID=A0A9W9DGD4_9AGAR|nr:hypothetical protein J3R30DRAFT_1682837 [Lentinula aciculospora]